ncbi:MAG: hypothetical protein IGQ45_13870 [Cyanobacterium sp. T60_A2020_053]|nr:hypothetical protein [Cyanobacterium sp. T60_A2020_053]
MAITLEEIMAKMPEERQNKIIARAQELKQEEEKTIVVRKKSNWDKLRNYNELSRPFK